MHPSSNRPNYKATAAQHTIIGQILEKQSELSSGTAGRGQQFTRNRPVARGRRFEWEKSQAVRGKSLVSSLCTMDRHIIFNPGTVERLTPGRFAFTRAPGPAGPHPAPVSKSQHNLQGGRELEQCRGAFCHDSGFSFLLFFSLTPLCENIIASFSLGRNFPLSFFFMLHERAGGGVCLWAFFYDGTNQWEGVA